MKKNKYIAYIFIIFLIILILLTIQTFVVENNYSDLTEKEMTAISINLKAENELNTAINILNWTNKSISPFSKKNIFDYPYLISPRNSSNSQVAYNTKHGNCEEYAKLFVKMTNLAGLNSRTVYNSSEDHVWAEVKIDGEWIHFDPSSNYYASPNIYELPTDLNGWNKKISFIYTIDELGNLLRLTDKYTGVGELVLNIKFNDVPIEGANVLIKSLYLSEKNPNLFIDLITNRGFVIERFTDISGIAKEALGENNYIIKVKKTLVPFLISLYGEKFISIKENEKNNFEVDLSYNVEPFGFILILVILIYILYLYIEKRRRTKC